MESGRYTLPIGPPLFPVDLLARSETDGFATRCLYGNSSRVLTHLPDRGRASRSPNCFSGDRCFFAAGPTVPVLRVNELFLKMSGDA